MKRKATFSQIEMARMAKKKRDEEALRQQRVRERRELYSAREAARTAEARAVKLGTSEIVGGVVRGMTQKMAEDARKVLESQFSRMMMDVYDAPSSSAGEVKVVTMTLPELRWNYAIPVRDIQRFR